MEHYALIKVGEVADQCPQTMRPERRTFINAVVRTYESRDRAMEDLVLLQETNRDELFNVVPVPHIER